MRVVTVAFAVMLASVSVAFAQADHVDMVTGASGVKWGSVPASFPKGAQLAVLSGDPSKSGPYVVRLRMPANYQIPAHHHPTTENVTVISGSFHAGMGDKMDQSKAQTFEPGGFISMPAQMNHYAWASAETIVQVHGDGPFEIIYVNAVDDPSKR